MCVGWLKVFRLSHSISNPFSPETYTFYAAVAVVGSRGGYGVLVPLNPLSKATTLIELIKGK